MLHPIPCVAHFADQAGEPGASTSRARNVRNYSVLPAQACLCHQQMLYVVNVE